MQTNEIKTDNVTGVITVTQQMGDTLANLFEKTKDLRVASISLSAYKAAISGAKAQVIYKKITGNPVSIKFFED